MAAGMSTAVALAYGPAVEIVGLIPSVRREARLRRHRQIDALPADGSQVATVNPSIPWRTVSRYPFQSLTTKGSPAAIASIGVRPKVSWMLSENEVNRSAADQMRKRTSWSRPSRKMGLTDGQ